MMENSSAGAIGFVDETATLLIRFDEDDAARRPTDATGALQELDVTIGSTVMPDIVTGVLGRAREFNGSTTGLAAVDLAAGSTLLTRDMSIQVVMSWDAAIQAAGAPGCVICRGLGTSSSERVCYGLQLDVVDAPTFRASMRWLWQDVGGTLHVQAGAQFSLPPGQFTMLTATRRWVSPTQVELAYYIGSQLLGTVTSANGSIGGGTTGTTQIGYRSTAGVNGNFLAGAIDELMIVGRELCAEEIEDTWLRITDYQIRGMQLFRESFDDGFPLTDDPDSDAAKDIRETGQVLGFAASRIENLRANFLPGRAYGTTLEQWEKAVAVTPKPVDGIQQRRQRVLGRLRQKRGISIDGLKDALAELLDCSGDDLEFIAYDNTIRDGFDTAIDTILWDETPTGCAAWNAGKARFSPAAGTYDFAHRAWLTMARPVSQPVAVPDPILGTLGLEHVLAKLVIPTPQNNAEFGVWFGDKGAGNYMLLGLRQDGTFKVVSEAFLAGVSQGLVVQATPGSLPAAIWLHLYQANSGDWQPAWSTTSGTAGFTLGTTEPFTNTVHWGGLYFRSEAIMGAGAVADFDDFILWTPRGTRPYSAYVFRDPGLGGHPDIEGANSVLQAIAHAYTHTAVITSRAFLAGDPGSVAGRGPMGTL
jgi:hypothetical protein